MLISIYDAFWTHALELKATWCVLQVQQYITQSIYKKQPLKQVLRCSHHSSCYLRAKPDGLKVPSEHLKIRLICNAAAGLQSFIATELRDVFGAVILPSYGMTEYVLHIYPN